MKSVALGFKPQHGGPGKASTLATTAQTDLFGHALVLLLAEAPTPAVCSHVVVFLDGEGFLPPFRILPKIDSKP